MIIVRIIGGLGNQMFQYVFYNYLKSKFKNVKADISDFKRYKIHDGYLLKKVFNIKLDLIEESKIKYIKDFAFSPNRHYISKIRYKLFGKKRSHIFENEFNSNIVNRIPDVYLSGYWQKKVYLERLPQKIENDFKFDLTLNKKNRAILSEIQNSNSVSIHVRRGDYKTSKNHMILDSKYYWDSINFFIDRFRDVKFFLFSDDIKWVKENIKGEKIKYVEGNLKNDCHTDMFLMKNCKHNIIANSSFSWWGANLNNNFGKIVIAPYNWHKDPIININVNKNLIFDNWIQIK